MSPYESAHHRSQAHKQANAGPGKEAIADFLAAALTRPNSDGKRANRYAGGNVN
jgi:hypothetical protein